MKPILPRRAAPKKNEATIDIETLTNAGDGLGRLGQQAVFVPGTMPGDTVRVKLIKQKPAWASARLIELISASPDRLTPRCQYAGECGGCDWQHVPYEQQLEAKRLQFVDVMQRIGGFSDLTVPAVTASPQPYGYRNRIQGEVRDGQFYFRARQSGAPVAIHRCEISEEPINDWLQHSVESQANGRIEVAIENGEVVTQPVNEQRSTELGFRQVNTGVSQLLTSLVHQSVAGSNSNRVFDLYCGRGDWALDIARRYTDREVIGVDVSADNINIARQRATALLRDTSNGSGSLAQLQFKVARVEKAIRAMSLNDALCILDPPRAGLDDAVIAALLKQRPAELVYVSCHPATLARDLKRLCASAYDIAQLELLDMFPQTAHLESFVRLHRKPA